MPCDYLEYSWLEVGGYGKPGPETAEFTEPGALRSEGPATFSMIFLQYCIIIKTVPRSYQS